MFPEPTKNFAAQIFLKKGFDKNPPNRVIIVKSSGGWFLFYRKAASYTYFCRGWYHSESGERSGKKTLWGVMSEFKKYVDEQDKPKLFLGPSVKWSIIKK